MSRSLQSSATSHGARAAVTHGFRPLRVVLPALVALLAVQGWIQWHAREVALPRYCNDLAGTVGILEKIISEKHPAGNEPRRPYLVAAKLLFLLPRASNEPSRQYLARVHAHLAAQCRQRI